MSVGTPVIAFSCGSVPEIMIDGKTGFVVNDIDEAVEAVEKVAMARPGGVPGDF